MGRARTGWIGSPGILLAAFLALGAAAPDRTVPESRPRLRADSQRLVLPPVGKDDLLSPTADPGHRRQRASISLEVEPPRDDRGWKLLVRTASVTGRGPAARPPRVLWKLVSESPSDFRPLGTEEQLVKRSLHPTQEMITIDVVFGVDWNVAPGRYDVDFLFSLEPL